MSVSFTSAGDDIVSWVDADTVSFTGVGSVQIIAEQPGNLYYQAAVPVTNTWTIESTPIAGDLTITNSPGEPCKMNVGKLLAVCSDPAGLTLGVASVDNTSAGGQTVTWTGSWIFYLPATNYTSADSFTFSITNSLGNSSEAQVIITVDEAEEETLSLDIVPNANNSVSVIMHGIPGREVVIEYTDQLDGEWSPLETNVFSNIGYFEFHDSDIPAQRFYRMRAIRR